MGKVLFSQVSVCPHTGGGGISSPSHNTSTGHITFLEVPPPVLDRGRGTPSMTVPLIRSGWGIPPVGLDRGTAPGQVMPRAVCLLRFPAGGLSYDNTRLSQVIFTFQASTSWLAGTNTGPFVVSVREEEAFQKDHLGLNWTYMLNTAINNLHKCLWFGILEDLERSMELFKFQTGLNATTHKMNVSIRKEDNITKAELEKLQALMPMDIYLYEYAKQLHEYRWQKYKHNWNNVSNYKPRLPQTIRGCKSTRHFLDCPELSIHFPVNKTVGH